MCNNDDAPTCENKGVCVAEGTEPVCRCVEPWTGATCNKKKGKNPIMQHVVSIHLNTVNKLDIIIF